VNNPGYWTCSKHGHTLLQWATNLNDDSTAVGMGVGEEGREELLTTKAILHSFGVLLPEACYLGTGFMVQKITFKKVF